MRIRRDDEPRGSLNLTPLIDMLFILIVFFLATSRLREEERDESIELVSTSNKRLPIAPPSDILVIDIDRDGRKLVHGKERTLEELEGILRTRIEENPEGDVIVRADKRATVAHFAETTEICHRLGLRDPKLTYSQD